MVEELGEKMAMDIAKKAGAPEMAQQITSQHINGINMEGGGGRGIEFKIKLSKPENKGLDGYQGKNTYQVEYCTVLADAESKDKHHDVNVDLIAVPAAIRGGLERSRHKKVPIHTYYSGNTLQNVVRSYNTAHAGAEAGQENIWQGSKKSARASAMVRMFDNIGKPGTSARAEAIQMLDAQIEQSSGQEQKLAQQRKERMLQVMESFHKEGVVGDKRMEALLRGDDTGIDELPALFKEADQLFEDMLAA